MSSADPGLRRPASRSGETDGAAQHATYDAAAFPVPGRALSATRSSLFREALGFVVLLFLSFALWTLAYQTPVWLSLAVGGDNVSYRREDDRPFLLNVNGSEPADRTHPDWPDWWKQGPAYRWTRSDSTLLVPGLGGGAWVVAALASSGRPDAAPVVSQWQLGDATLPLTITGTVRRYHLLVPAEGGDLRVQMRTPPYVSPSDPRDLGFVLRDLRIGPATTGLRLPAPGQFGWLALALALIYLLSRWFALTRYRAIVLLGNCSIVITVLLATQRAALTVFTPTIAALAACCAAMAAVAYAGVWLCQAGSRSAAIRSPRFNNVLALVLLAFALRMGGMLHPQATFSDHKLHANNLFGVSLGTVFFTEGLPSESGGGSAPYPPGVYLLLAPAELVFEAGMAGRVLLVQSGVALLDSLVVALIGLLLWRAGLGRRAALLGAALYLLPLPLLLSFSVGEYANIGGQALALPALACLAWGTSETPQQRRALSVLLVTVLLLLGVLGHFGVAITMALFLAGFWLVLGVEWLISRAVSPRDRLSSTVGAGVLAALGAGLVYYSAPIFLATFTQRRASSGATSGTPPAQIIAGLTVDLLQADSRLAFLLVAAGALGLALVWARGVRPVRGLAQVLAGWWGGVLLAQGILLFAGQGVRWQHFFVPALCLGAGPALAAFWRRGRAGRLTAVALLAVLLASSMMTWVFWIRDYLH